MALLSKQNETYLMYAAGAGLVNWGTMSKIAASWVISPVFGASVAAALLMFIKVTILNVEDRLQAASKWVPMLIGLMAVVNMCLLVVYINHLRKVLLMAM